MSQNNTHATPTASGAPFTDEQTQYLQGFMAGSGIAGNLANLPSFASMQTPIASAPKSVRPARPEDIHLEAQDRTTASGRKLVNEEIAKANQAWAWTSGTDVIAHARDGKFPQGNRRVPLQIHGHVLRRPGPGRVHVPASFPRRRGEVTPAPRRCRTRGKLRRRIRGCHDARQPPAP